MSQLLTKSTSLNPCLDICGPGDADQPDTTEVKEGATQATTVMESGSNAANLPSPNAGPGKEVFVGPSSTFAIGGAWSRLELQRGTDGCIILHGRFSHAKIPFDNLIGARRRSGSTLEIAALFETAASRKAKIGSQVEMDLKTYNVTLENEETAQQLESTLVTLARTSGFEQDRSYHLFVVVNPHGGKRRAPFVWKNKMEPLLSFAHLTYDVVETQYAGHAINMGRAYDPDKYEGVIVFGGDGTCQEFLSGLLSRPNWSLLLRRTPIATVKLGTNNAIATGIRTVHPEFSAYCVIKRQLRPLDGMLVTNAAGLRGIAACVVGWGMASSVALESEATRSSMGVYRYSYLKGRHALQFGLGTERYTGTLEYSADLALSDTELASYLAAPIPPRHSTLPPAHSDGQGALAQNLYVDPQIVSKYTPTDMSTIMEGLKAAHPSAGRGDLGNAIVDYKSDSILGLHDTAEATAATCLVSGQGTGLVNILVPTAKVVEVATIPSTVATAERTEITNQQSGKVVGTIAPDSSTKDKTAAQLFLAQTAAAPAKDSFGSPVPHPCAHMASGSGRASARSRASSVSPMHPMLESAVQEPLAVLDAVAVQAQELDADIVHVDDARAYRPPSAMPKKRRSLSGRTEPTVSGAAPTVAQTQDNNARPVARQDTGGQGNCWIQPNGGFGELVQCRRDCEVCKSNGRLRFIGHKCNTMRLSLQDFSVDEAAGPSGGAGIERHARSCTQMFRQVPLTAADVSDQNYSQTLGLDVTSRGYVKRKERGSYLTIAAITLAPEAKYQHGSDGYTDLLIARVGTVKASLGLFRRYVGAWFGLTEIYDSPLIDYVKVRSMVISPDAGQEDTVLNVDGEAFPGPGPFRVHVLPSLFTMYGTY